MPIITKVTAQKRPGYYNIFLDDEFWCGLTDLQVIAQGLHKGTKLTDEEAARMCELSVSTKAYHAAIRFLSYRMRSEQEMTQYLKRKGHEEHIAEVMEQLRSERYIDDADFALRWVAMRQQEGKSPRIIGLELLKKGIQKDYIDSALEGYETDDRLTSLKQALDKQRATGRPLEKVIQSLQRKGWSYGDIKSVLDNEE